MASLPQKMQIHGARIFYFHGRGKAEQARWLLAANGTSFKNVCLDTHEEFLKLKEENKLEW